MTTIGPYYSGMEKIGEFTMPQEYVGSQMKRSNAPGPRNRVENY